MREFLGGFAPILVMWAVPLAPMLYAAIRAVLEAVAEPAGRVRPELRERLRERRTAVGETGAIGADQALRRRSPSAPD